MAMSEMWLTGNLKDKGEVIDIVPGKSMAWLDRQYSVGAGREGWDLYMLLFENGMKTNIWHSEVYGGTAKEYFTIVVYPDSYHEMCHIDDIIEVSQPFTSE